MISIEHIAFWVRDLEKMKNFYSQYFRAEAGEMYYNPVKNFRSYFLKLGTGCRLELMNMPSISDNRNNVSAQYMGLIHFAVSVGSKEEVDRLTEVLCNDGYLVIGKPRTTGDGYYESVIADPEGNRIEITI